MKTLLISAAAAAVVLAATPHATASPITFTFSGASVTFGASGTDTITGSFAYDTSTNTMSQVNVSVAGPVYPSASSVSYLSNASNAIYFGPPGDVLDYLIFFGSNLNGSGATPRQHLRSAWPTRLSSLVLEAKIY